MTRRGREGTVLMETVLAIPLFMVLLGGIFWIGDLTVTRQQLLVADRYLAWNKGVRYDDKGAVDADTLHQLFFSDREGVKIQEHPPTVRAAEVTAVYDWSQEAQGQASVKVRTPDWVGAMLDAMNLQFRGTGGAVMETTVFGREHEGDRHVVLMRTKPEAQMSYIRNKYGVNNSSEVAAKWKDIAGEKWPYE